MESPHLPIFPGRSNGPLPRVRILAIALEGGRRGGGEDARGYNGPLLGYILNRYVDSENRATVISIKATALFLGEFIGAFMGG